VDPTKDRHDLKNPPGRQVWFLRRLNLLEELPSAFPFLFASAKHGRPGRGWAGRYDSAWFQRLGVYRLSGTVRHGTAHASR
jgi:hypothetical protein